MCECIYVLIKVKLEIKRGIVELLNHRSASVKRTDDDKEKIEVKEMSDSKSCGTVYVV